MSFYDNFLTETHRMVRDTCRRFAEKEILPNAHEWEEAEAFPKSLYAKAGAAGIIGGGFPEEVGGSGGGPMEMVMGIEGLMRGGSTGVAVGLGIAGIALPPIIQSGNEALIDRYVRPVIAGQKVGALCITEPGTGSDVAAVSTRGRLDGDHYVVNGSKMFITSGVVADAYTTLVRTGDDPHMGLTFVVIDADSPGVSVSRSLKKTGWRASDTAELAFEDVRVPVSNRVGAEGSAFATLMRNFQTERLALAAYGVATALIAWEEALAYAKERQAFGKSLMGFQVTRHKLADMATQVTAARTFLYQVASRMGEGQEVIAEVSMAKNMAAQTAIDVCYEAVQIHGGMGYMRETLVERLSRDARLLPIGGGTQEIMKEIIGKRLGF
jgi:acyl-CoA dehydrogenase